MQFNDRAHTMNDQRYNAARAYAALAIAACLGATLSACETIIDSNDVPYVDRLVIEAVIDADSAISGIRITHTLPLDRVTTTEESYVPNLTGAVTTRDGRFPLVYQGSGLFAAPGAIAHAGDVCSIETSWNGEPVRAHTRIPLAPQVLQTVFSGERAPDSGYVNLRSVECWVNGLDSMAVYAASIYVVTEFFGRDGRGYRSSNGDLKQPHDTAADGRLDIGMPNTHFYCREDSSLFEVSAYDHPYYDFVQTFTNGGNDDFFDSSTPVRWNVEGNGIGIFIGRNRLRIPVRVN